MESLGRCRLFFPCESFVFPLKSVGHAEVEGTEFQIDALNYTAPFHGNDSIN